jgi:hypothetical protein
MSTGTLQGGITFLSDHNPIPGMISRPLAASEQAGKGQFVVQSPTTGYAALATGSVPGQISLGIADVADISDTSTVAGQARVRLSERWFYGLPYSTTSNDGFTDADFGVPFWIADSATLGKLSNSGGSNRTLGGLVFGLAPNGTPFAWAGPIAQQLAKSALVTNAFVGGSLKISDATAGATQAEFAMLRAPQHGVVTAVEFIGAAVATNSSNSAQVTIKAYTGTTSRTIATLDTSTTAISAFVPCACTLSTVAANLNLLETDVLTYTKATSGSGAQLLGTIRVVQKVV